MALKATYKKSELKGITEQRWAADVGDGLVQWKLKTRQWGQLMNPTLFMWNEALGLP